VEPKTGDPAGQTVGAPEEVEKPPGLGGTHRQPIAAHGKTNRRTLAVQGQEGVETFLAADVMRFETLEAAARRKDAAASRVFPSADGRESHESVESRVEPWIKPFQGALHHPVGETDRDLEPHPAVRSTLRGAFVSGKHRDLFRSRGREEGKIGGDLDHGNNLAGRQLRFSLGRAVPRPGKTTVAAPSGARQNPTGHGRWGVPPPLLLR
jgi:hypothetical protein